jgi:hypothetical protein
MSDEVCRLWRWKEASGRPSLTRPRMRMATARLVASPWRTEGLDPRRPQDPRDRWDMASINAAWSSGRSRTRNRLMQTMGGPYASVFTGSGCSDTGDSPSSDSAAVSLRRSVVYSERPNLTKKRGSPLPFQAPSKCRTSSSEPSKHTCGTTLAILSRPLSVLARSIVSRNLTDRPFWLVEMSTSAGFGISSNGAASEATSMSLRQSWLPTQFWIWGWVSRRGSAKMARWMKMKLSVTTALWRCESWGWQNDLLFVICSN